MKVIFARALLAILVIGVLLPAAAAGQEEAIRKADRALTLAVRKNKAAVAPKLDDNFTSTDVAGTTRSKAQFLRSFAPSDAIGSEQGLKIRSYGDVGLVQALEGNVYVVRVWVKRPAGWRMLVHQDTAFMPEAPSGAGSNDGQNPCKTVPSKPKSPAQQGVISSWQALETAVTNHDSAGWAPHIADEFVLISSGRDRPLTKADRMAILDRQKKNGDPAAPPPLVSARMYDFGDTVVMTSRHQAPKAKPVHVTRVWVKHGNMWQLAFSQQTTMQAAAVAETR